MVIQSRAARAAAALLVVVALGAAACSSDSDDTSTPATASGTKSVSEASPAELEKWQTDLNAVGCWSGAVDGEMGPETENAIKEFQSAEGLTVDGLLGPDTESALTSAVDAGETVCTSSPGTTKATTGTTATPGTTESPNPAQDGDDEQALEEYVAREFTSAAAECNPPVYDGPTSGVDTQVDTFVASSNANGIVGPDVLSQGTGSDWEATFTGGQWDVSFGELCGSN